MRLRPVVLGFLGAATAATAAAAAQLSSIIVPDNGTIIALKGDIEEGDTEAAEALIKSINDDGRLVSALQLDSPGGGLAEAVRLAELIRRAKVPTVVAAGSRCASACFIVFAAGVEKFASFDAAIGVHGVSDRFGHQTEQTEAATMSMARIAGTFGVPPGIVRRIIITRPTDIAWLSADDLRAMGTIMTGRPKQIADATSAADRRLAALDRVSGGNTEPPTPTLSDATAAADRGDYARAIQLWRRFAVTGDGVAQYNLGQLYASGEGVAQDLAQAAHWYQLAAQHGIADAQLYLGIAYALGRGVPVSLPEAHRWLDLAATTSTTSDGRSRAIKARDLIATRMTAADIATAQRLRREWSDRYMNGR